MIDGVESHFQNMVFLDFGNISYCNYKNQLGLVLPLFLEGSSEYHFSDLTVAFLEVSLSTRIGLLDRLDTFKTKLSLSYLFYFTV